MDEKTAHCIYQFSDNFFPSTSRLWNSLPSPVFPASFKRQVYHHLRDQMAWFFSLLIFFFFHVDITIPFFKYFCSLFYYSTWDYRTLLLISRDTDLRKGTMCPFSTVPIHKRKKKKLIPLFLCVLSFPAFSKVWKERLVWGYSSRISHLVVFTAVCIMTLIGIYSITWLSRMFSSSLRWWI